MAKRLKPRERSPFLTGAAIYAGVALLLIGVGLFFLWQFLAAYEASRPRNTVEDYLDDLTSQHILEVAGPDLISQVDAGIQSEAEAREEILVALQGKFTCARNVSKSTDGRQVYVLRKGAQVIGSFDMEPTGKPSWGFTPWSVTGEEFDLSFLLGETVSVLAPEGYTVLVNGNPLPDTCAAETGIPYPALAEFAGEYALPTLTRYEAGPVLGEVTLRLRDADGKEITPPEDADLYLDNCSQAEREALTLAVNGFLRTYVDYTSCTGGSPSTTLQWLKKLMVPGSDLAKRMQNALAGLYWVSDRHATVADVEIGLVSRLSPGLYLCDVTYGVNTRDLSGEIRAESHVKLLFRQSGSSLLAEAMATC